MLVPCCRRAACLLVAAAALLALPGAAQAAPVTVTLRIEGLTSTIYEGPVATDARTFAKDASGPHPCDGTNGAVNPSPGPTMTSALQDGQAPGGYTWDGTWFAGFDDFGIDRIGPDASDNVNFRYWGYALNGVPTAVGGCQQRVAAGDEVLFAYDMFGRTVLRLALPATATAGDPVTATVTNAETGTPVAGAAVLGAATGADGTAAVTFPAAGVQRVKAEKAGAIRSNAAAVCVHAGNDGTCGTVAPGATAGGAGSAGGGPGAPATPPAASIATVRAGQRFTLPRAPRLLRGTVRPGSGPLRTVRLRLLRQRAGRCQYWSVRFERFHGTDACAAGPYRYGIGTGPAWSYLLPQALAPGRYTLEITAIATDGGRDVERAAFTVLAAGARQR